MLVAPGHKIPPSCCNHGSDRVKPDLPGTCDGIGSVADVAGPAKRERLPAGHRGIRRDLVTVIDHQAWAEMEAAGERKPVEVSFERAEAQVCVVADSVVGKAPAVTEGVEAKTKIGVISEWRSRLNAGTQQRYLHTHPEFRSDRHALALRGRG